MNVLHTEMENILLKEIIELTATKAELLEVLRQCNDLFATVNDDDIPERLSLSVALAVAASHT